MGSNSFLDPKYDGLSAKETIRQVYRDNLLEDQTKALQRQAEAIEEAQRKAELRQLEEDIKNTERNIREDKRKEIYSDYYALLEKIEYSKDYFTHQYGKDPKADKLYEAQFGTFEEWITNHKKSEILKKRADYEWNLYLEIRNTICNIGDGFYCDVEYLISEKCYNNIGIYPPKITNGIMSIFIFFIFMEIIFLPIMFIDVSEGKSIFSIATMIIGGLSALVLLVTILKNIGEISAYKRETAEKKLQWKKDKDWYDKKMKEAEKERHKFDEIINVIELFNNKRENFSTSLIQKELKMGYARAKKVYDEMIDLGLITNSKDTNIENIETGENNKKEPKELILEL